MKTLRVVLTMLVVVPLAIVVPAQAQTTWDLAPHLGLNLDNDELFLGGSARITLPTAPVKLNPGIEFYPFIGSANVDVSLFVVNFDVLYDLTAKSVEPYGGGGLFWSRTSVTVGGTIVSDSDIGLNLKGGLVFGVPGSPIRPYGEGVLMLSSGSALLLKGGFLFAIGK